jgi:hypothetical protein
MKSIELIPRRAFLITAAVSGGGVWLSGCASAGRHVEDGKAPAEDVSPAEDLDQFTPKL